MSFETGNADSEGLGERELRQRCQKGGKAGLVGRKRLFLPVKFPAAADVLAVITEVDASEDEFPIAPAEKSFRFGQHFFRRDAGKFAAEIRNETIGAELLTAILNFQVSPVS